MVDFRYKRKCRKEVVENVPWTGLGLKKIYVQIFRCEVTLLLVFYINNQFSLIEKNICIKIQSTPHMQFPVSTFGVDYWEHDFKLEDCPEMIVAMNRIMEVLVNCEEYYLI